MCLLFFGLEQEVESDKKCSRSNAARCETGGRKVKPQKRNNRNAFGFCFRLPSNLVSVTETCTRLINLIVAIPLGRLKNWQETKRFAVTELMKPLMDGSKKCASLTMPPGGSG